MEVPLVFEVVMWMVVALLGLLFIAIAGMMIKEFLDWL